MGKSVQATPRTSASPRTGLRNLPLSAMTRTGGVRLWAAYLTWVFVLERVTGIEPALSAWEAAGALQSTTPISSCEQEIQLVNSATLPLWVENWVENRYRLESVEVGAA